jgi:hypothetical protein
MSGIKVADCDVPIPIRLITLISQYTDTCELYFMTMNLVLPSFA